MLPERRPATAHSVINLNSDGGRGGGDELVSWQDGHVAIE
jgi:hypothetical protein